MGGGNLKYISQMFRIGLYFGYCQTALSSRGKSLISDCIASIFREKGGFCESWLILSVECKH